MPSSVSQDGCLPAARSKNAVETEMYELYDCVCMPPFIAEKVVHSGYICVFAFPYNGPKRRLRKIKVKVPIGILCKPTLRFISVVFFFF